MLLVTATVEPRLAEPDRAGLQLGENFSSLKTESA